MSGAPLMRPAARSAAVRPHSSSLPSPRPASAASSCFASLFFVSPPRPVERQSYWQALACSQCGWEQGHGWERVREQEYREFSGAYVTVPTVPSVAGAHVMRSRAHARQSPSLLLGTWKQSLFLVQYQRLALFPRLFPPLLAVGTWEHAERRWPVSDRRSARSNKVEAGNGSQQRPAAGARRKFRSAIALELGRDLVDQAQLRPDPRNGGNQPFPARLAGHVGTLVLEGSSQGTDRAAESGQRRKLGRLCGLALGAAGAELTRRPPGAPNAPRAIAGMLALHAGRIWIEGPFRAGSSDDRLISTVGEETQTCERQRGPGGIRLSNVARKAERSHSRRAGKRAGVNRRPAIARPHEAGELQRLLAISCAVKRGPA